MIGISTKMAHLVANKPDSVPELQVMISTLHKEMGMMQSQLNKFKEAAREVHSLQAEIHSLAVILERKTEEWTRLSDHYVAQVADLTALKAEVESLRQSDQELQLIVEMYKRESTNPGSMMDLQQDHCSSGWILLFWGHLSKKAMKETNFSRCQPSLSVRGGKMVNQ